MKLFLPIVDISQRRMPYDHLKETHIQSVYNMIKLAIANHLFYCPGKYKVTYISLCVVQILFLIASGAIHFIGSFFCLFTSYMLPSVWRIKPKSAILTSLFSPTRTLRAAKSRWINPLLDR